MGSLLKNMAIGLLAGMWVSTCEAEEVANGITREQIKALDGQVQDLKKDVLDISNNLIQFEEKFIYPPDTRVSIFLAVAQSDKSRFDKVKIRIDGKDAASHSYTSGELDALRLGGVQRIYTGNIRGGEHALEVALTGKSTGDVEYQQSANYKFTKETGAKLIEITLAEPGSGNQGIGFRD